MLALIAYGLFWGLVGGLSVEHVIAPDKPVEVQEVGSGLPDIDPACWTSDCDFYDCINRPERCAVLVAEQ